MPNYPDDVELDTTEGDGPFPEGEIDADTEPIPPGYNDFSEYDPGDLKEQEDFAQDTDFHNDVRDFDNDY